MRSMTAWWLGTMVVVEVEWVGVESCWVWSVYRVVGCLGAMLVG